MKGRVHWLDAQREAIRASWRFAMYWQIHWDIVMPSEGRGLSA